MQPSESKPNVTPLTVLAHVLCAIKSYAHLLYVQRLIPHQVCCRIRFAFCCFCYFLFNLLGFPPASLSFSLCILLKLPQCSYLHSAREELSNAFCPRGDPLNPPFDPPAGARWPPWSGEREPALAGHTRGARCRWWFLWFCPAVSAVLPSRFSSCGLLYSARQQVRCVLPSRVLRGLTSLCKTLRYLIFWPLPFLIWSLRKVKNMGQHRHLPAGCPCLGWLGIAGVNRS